MSLELSKLTGAVEQMGRAMVARQSDHAARILEARALLAEHPDVTDELREKIRSAQQTDEWRRGAEPRGDKLLERDRFGSTPERHTLIAADGSQIFPDRHAITLYYLLNVGSIVLRCGSGQTPVTSTQPEVFYTTEDLFDERGNLRTPEYVGLQRGRQEIEMLARLAEQERAMLGGDLSVPIIALTDGPLLPWLRQEHDASETLQKEMAFTAAQLERMRRAQVIPIGYVDRPTSAYVLRILELLHLPLATIDREALRKAPYQELIDRSLFSDLAPNERTAVFSASSQANDRFMQASNGDRIAFAYVNVARPGDAPTIARMEFPGWVADDPARLDAAQGAIYANCEPDGYPYVLTRAHELAVVKPGEREHLEAMLMRSLLSNGLMPETSPKARNKLLIGGRPWS